MAGQGSSSRSHVTIYIIRVAGRPTKYSPHYLDKLLLRKISDIQHFVLNWRRRFIVYRVTGALDFADPWATWRLQYNAATSPRQRTVSSVSQGNLYDAMDSDNYKHYYCVEIHELSDKVQVLCTCGRSVVASRFSNNGLLAHQPLQYRDAVNGKGVTTARRAFFRTSTARGVPFL